MCKVLPKRYILKWMIHPTLTGYILDYGKVAWYDVLLGLGLVLLYSVCLSCKGPIQSAIVARRYANAHCGRSVG